MAGDTRHPSRYRPRLDPSTAMSILRAAQTEDRGTRMCANQPAQPDRAGFQCGPSVAILSGVMATVLALVGVPAIAGAQPPASRVHLVLEPQRVLRAVISQRTFIRQSGQTVTGTLLEPIYAYDRIVLPQGTPVRI